MYDKLNISMPDSPLLNAAKDLVRRVRAAGFDCALVGGVVRDLVWGRTPKDCDLVSSVRPDELSLLLPGTEMVGAGFGVSLVCFDGFCFEVATAREERNYLDGRHPEQVRYTTDLQTDVIRRDFTMNALLLDPLTGEVHDHVGGLADMERGILRTVGDPSVRFKEDYLRMLRAVRFAARFRFRIDEATAAAIRSLAPWTAELASERVGQELTMMLTGGNPALAMDLARELGLLDVLLPEVAALHGVEQPAQHHPEGDVWRHTMIMLDAMAAPTAELAWSVLLHDVGKPASRSMGADGVPHFFNHEHLGEPIVRAIFSRLRFSRERTEVVAHAVRNHMAFGLVRRESRIRRELAGANLALEMELNRLDARSMRRCSDQFLLYLDRLGDTSPALPEPLLRGRDLVAAGYRPGPAFRTVLDQAFELQLEGELTTFAEALQWAATALRKD